MYSTSYHTAYHDDTLAELCDETRLTTSSCWGPAHEVGHSNQTRPGLKWLGTTEVTNNILSQYIQTTVYGQPSRIQTENMGDTANPNRYTKAWSGIVVKRAPHSTEGDVFCKLIPFWQLELYFGKVLGRTPMQQSDHGGFYADCFEWVRTHDDLPTAGDQQLEFVYIASKCAGTDLTDFFTKWGFFTPVDTTIDDYGKGQMTVTQQMGRPHALARQGSRAAGPDRGAGVYHRQQLGNIQRKENRRGRFGHTHRPYAHNGRLAECNRL